MLRRIADGDDLSDPDVVSLRLSARALASRGLVTVSRRDGWRATITDAGRSYVQHGHHPELPVTGDQGDRASSDDDSAATKRVRSDKAGRDAGATARERRPPHATAAIAAQRRQAAEELLAALQRDGQMTIEDATAEQRNDLRRAIDFAKRHGLVPDGKRLEKSHWQTWSCAHGAPQRGHLDYKAATIAVRAVLVTMLRRPRSHPQLDQDLRVDL